MVHIPLEELVSMKETIARMGERLKKIENSRIYNTHDVPFDDTKLRVHKPIPNKPVRGLKLTRGTLKFITTTGTKDKGRAP